MTKSVCITRRLWFMVAYVDSIRTNLFTLNKIVNKLEYIPGYMINDQYRDGTEKNERVCEQYLKVPFEGTYNAYTFSTKLVL